MNSSIGIIKEIKTRGRTILTEIEAKQVVKGAGIKTVETRLASSQKQALEICNEIGFPVVLKIASPDITHKSDAGGVKTGLNNAAEMKQAYGEIMAPGKEKFPKP